MMEKIEITVDGNKTIAKMDDKKGIAVCSPEDEFNIFVGAKLALDRLEEDLNHCSWIKIGMAYYVPTPMKKDLFERYMNVNDEIDKMYISRGLVFRTKEEAIEAAKKMLAALKEG